MKTILHTLALIALTFTGSLHAQDVTTVRANNSDISDNLDLKAIASIFGDSRDLEDFERRLNDPEIQISNLDLNNDNQVDYLRIIEATERNTHLIIIQAVLGADVFQDVATVEVEKDRSNNVQVQVVGDSYMYGSNYIYEPVYVSRPLIYDAFWVSSYRPYYSPWYWGYYPTYYSYWAPYPVYRYRNNIHVHINSRNTYNYVNGGRSSRAVALHNGRRANGYERQYPQNSFNRRNANVSNRYALEQNRTATAGRNISNGSTRNSSDTGRGTRNSFSNSSVNSATRSTTGNSSSTLNTTTRTNRTNNTIQRASTSTRTSGTRNNEAATTRSSAPVTRSTPAAKRQSMPAVNTSRSSAPAVRSTPAATRQRIPAVRSTPTRSSAPAVRSAPAATRQSAPMRSIGGSSRRN